VILWELNNPLRENNFLLDAGRHATHEQSCSLKKIPPPFSSHSCYFSSFSGFLPMTCHLHRSVSADLTVPLSRNIHELVSVDLIGLGFRLPYNIAR